jgi:arylsulfatase A-like enzyme
LNDNKTLNIIWIACWFALVTGLIEGSIFMLFTLLGWQIVRMAVWIEILWISPIFNLILFGIFGLILAGSSRLFPRLPITLIAVTIFTFMAFLDWLSIGLIKYIHPLAVSILAVGITVQFILLYRKYQTNALKFFRNSLPWIASTVMVILVGIQVGQWAQERITIAKLPAPHPNSMNILVILVDTLRADHLSCYGYKRETSPHIDRIAQQGVLFENAFAPSSYTLPSHASILTGLYPYEHGVEWDTPRALFDAPHPSLGNAFQPQGYRTAAFSANIYWFTRALGFGRGFVHFEDYFQSIGDMIFRTVYGRAFETFVLQKIGFEDIPARKRAADVNRSFLKWVDRDTKRPFFAFLNYMDTHDPYLPPKPYRAKFSKLKNPGGILNWRVGRDDPKLTKAQIDSEIAAYDGGIAYVDDQIGQLLNELRVRGFKKNLLVVITSDHGEAFGEHGTFLHGNSLFQEEIHVPLIFWRPGQVPSGVYVAQPVSIVSLADTLMDLIGMNGSSPFSGRSLAEFWEAPQPPEAWPHPMAEINRQTWVPERAPVFHGRIRALVTPKWHYIVNEALGTEIYDWKNDLQESNNLANKPEMTHLIDQFEAQLASSFTHRKR